MREERAGTSEDGEIRSGAGGGTEGLEGKKPRVSRKAVGELRFETQCWAGFFCVGGPNKLDGNQGVWRDYFAFSAHNLSISVPKQGLGKTVSIWNKVQT